WLSFERVGLGCRGCASVSRSDSGIADPWFVSSLVGRQTGVGDFVCRGLGEQGSKPGFTTKNKEDHGAVKDFGRFTRAGVPTPREAPILPAPGSPCSRC